VDDPARRGSHRDAVGVSIGTRVLAGARGQQARSIGSVVGDVRRWSRRRALAAPRHEGVRGHQLSGVHQGVATNPVTLGQEALAYLVQETYARALQGAHQACAGPGAVYGICRAQQPRLQIRIGLELSKPRGARIRLLDESSHHYENATKERNVRRDVGDR